VAGGRQSLDLLLGDVGGQAAAVGIEGVVERRSGHGDGVQLLGLYPQGEIDRAGLGQLEIDVVLFDTLQPLLADLDLERPAHAQTLRVVDALGVGGDHARGARRHVDDGHGGTGHRLALRVDHLASDG
jgi:hypothetical protein